LCHIDLAGAGSILFDDEMVKQGDGAGIAGAITLFLPKLV
jgi:hypothetical protein